MLLRWWSCQLLKSCISKVRVTTDNDIRLMLDAQIVEREGGDFGIIQLANGRTHFKIWNPVDARCTDSRKRRRRFWNNTTC